MKKRMKQSRYRRQMCVMTCSLLLSLATYSYLGSSVDATETSEPFGSSARSWYRVVSGDTVYGIAKKFNLPVSSLIASNGLDTPDLIVPGQTLVIPDATSGDWGASSSRVLTATLTAYTAGPESTGKSIGDPDYGITASGTRVREGRTIAVDPKVIPIGTKVYIEGVGVRRAEDTGGAIKGSRIDVFMNDVKQARQFGVKKDVRVYILS